MGPPIIGIGGNGGMPGRPGGAKAPGRPPGGGNPKGGGGSGWPGRALKGQHATWDAMEVVGIRGNPSPAGGGKPGWPGIPVGIIPGIIPGIPGIGMVWPSAAYELVMESMTDCAFSCPISRSATRHVSQCA